MARQDPPPFPTDEAPRAGEKATHGAGGLLGAVAGAAAGAALGALAGPVGLAAGAVAGAVLGGVAGGNTVDRLDRNAARGGVASCTPERAICAVPSPSISTGVPSASRYSIWPVDCQCSPPSASDGSGFSRSYAQTL
jgi:hypothetical protein